MTTQNDQRRLGQGGGVEKVIEQRTNHRITRPTVTDAARRVITGTVVVDLTDLGKYFDEQVRHRLSVIACCPVGAHVRIDIGDVLPSAMYFAGIDLGTVRIEVAGNDPTNVGRWVRMISEVSG